MSGLVYFIVAIESPHDVKVKIGFTKGDPRDRLRNLQCGSPVPLRIYTAFEGDKSMERRFHETFAPLRLHGEWFTMKHKLQDFMLGLREQAMTRAPADWVAIFELIECIILADKPICKGVDPVEYMASADMAPWQWMRDALAEHDAEIEAELATVQ